MNGMVWRNMHYWWDFGVFVCVFWEGRLTLGLFFIEKCIFIGKKLVWSLLVQHTHTRMERDIRRCHC